MLERYQLNGQNLGLVWAASTKVLLYRTDLFSQVDLHPPKGSVAGCGTGAQSTSGTLWDCRFRSRQTPFSADGNFYFLLWTNGGDLLASDGRPLLNSPEAVESLTLLRDMVRKYRVTEPEIENCDRPCAEDLFARGKAAMVETGPWMIRTMAAKPHPIPYSVVPLPANKEAATQLVTDHLSF